MKKVIRLWPLLLLIILTMTACGASATGSNVQDPAIPTFTDGNFVIDTTGKMSADTKSQLDAITKGINADGFQMAIAVFNDCADCNTTLFANKIGDANKIGYAGKDNGIVVAIFLDKKGGDGNAPAIGVATGKGIEGMLNDAKVGRLVDATYVPQRTAGHWEQGVIDFAKATREVLNGKNADDFKAPPKDNSWIIWLIVIFVIFEGCDGIFFRFAITMAILDAAASSRSGGTGGGLSGGGGGFGGGGVSR